MHPFALSCVVTSSVQANEPGAFDQGGAVKVDSGKTLQAMSSRHTDFFALSWHYAHSPWNHGAVQVQA